MEKDTEVTLRVSPMTRVSDVRRDGPGRDLNLVTPVTPVIKRHYLTYIVSGVINPTPCTDSLL